jgi:hypothetical protein
MTEVAQAILNNAAPEPCEREAAMEILAQRLHAKMEILDPTSDTTWTGLSERQRDFYWHAVRAILQERRLVIAALA